MPSCNLSVFSGISSAQDVIVHRHGSLSSVIKRCTWFELNGRNAIY
jgi:hypothetical protein